MADKKVIFSISLDRQTLDRLTILCGMEQRNASNMVGRLINICFKDVPEHVKREEKVKMGE